MSEIAIFDVHYFEWHYWNGLKLTLKVLEMNLNLAIEYPLHAMSHSGDQNTRYSRIETILGTHYISESPLNDRRGTEEVCEVSRKMLHCGGK